ncbi:GTP 3',8-cyclase MoaA [Eubacterium aggregans]|uniref:GTP 3',8-cyclase MoaA n=1 Tax=Eubacterium aggregans TaxID=81409 RepID=UPI003F3B9C95
MKDQHGRHIDYMRLSITDRCDFRCVYCMPEDGVTPITHDEVLTFDEILRICRSAVALGITRFKVTGGEPLVRKGSVDLLARMNALPGVEQVTLTTNGYVLGQYVEALKEIGIDGINISLDTLDRERFQKITKRDGLDRVLQSLEKAVDAGILVKTNTVLMPQNREDWLGIADLARFWPVHVRYIEMMPIGMGRDYSGCTGDTVMAMLKGKHPNLMAVSEQLGNGPAQYFKIPGYLGRIGIISAVSHEFCETCNRVRVTSEGILKLCLNRAGHVDLRKLLRDGGDDGALTQTLATAILNKPLRHRFEIQCQEDEETRRMVGIGG